MVGDLLEMSRADAGSTDVFLDEVNVGELVRRAVEAGVRTLGEGATAPLVPSRPTWRWSTSAWTSAGSNGS